MSNTFNKKMINLSNKKRRLNNGSIIKIDTNRKFGEEVSNKYKNDKVDGEALYEIIKDYYNGYLLIDKFSGIKYEIYSPFSVIEAIKEEHPNNYQMMDKEILYKFI